MPLPDPVSRMNIGSYLHPSHLKVLCNLLSICVSLCSMLLKSVMLAAKVHSSLVAEIHTTSLGLFALYRGFCFPSLQLYILYSADRHSLSLQLYSQCCLACALGEWAWSCRDTIILQLS